MVVKSETFKLKSKDSFTYTYRVTLVSVNYPGKQYYSVNYEHGFFSFAAGYGNEYKQFKTKADAMKGYTAMKKKIRASGHPFRG